MGVRMLYYIDWKHKRIKLSILKTPKSVLNAKESVVGWIYNQFSTIV